MKKILVAIIFLLSGCSSIGINDTATFENEYPEDEYVIIVSGRNALMSHDLISAVFGSSYLTECHIRVKTIRGTINASDIQIIQLDDYGSIRKVKLIQGAKGNLVFDGNSLLIDIYIPTSAGAESGVKPYLFNGKYTLIRSGSN